MHSKRCKPGGRVVIEVIFQTQGPERSSRETSRRTGFYGVCLVSLQQSFLAYHYISLYVHES